MSFKAEMEPSQNPAGLMIIRKESRSRPRPQPTPIGTPAIGLFRQFNQRPDWALARGPTSGLIHNDGQGPDACLYRRHGSSNPAHFSPITGRFAIREAQAAGTVSMRISGSVADTCRGGIDTFSFPGCRHSLGGAASTRLISPRHPSMRSRETWR